MLYFLSNLVLHVVDSRTESTPSSYVKALVFDVTLC